MGPVRLLLAPHHANVRIARLIAGSVCRMAGYPEALNHDVRLAIGEACGRAVSAHRDRGIEGPVTIEIEQVDANGAMVCVAVLDRAPRDARATNGGPGEGAAVNQEVTGPTSLSDAITMPDPLTIIAGLADELEVRTTPAGGTVLIRWHLASSDN